VISFKLRPSYPCRIRHRHPLNRSQDELQIRPQDAVAKRKIPALAGNRNSIIHTVAQSIYWAICAERLYYIWIQMLHKNNDITQCNFSGINMNCLTEINVSQFGFHYCLLSVSIQFRLSVNPLCIFYLISFLSRIRFFYGSAVTPNTTLEGVPFWEPASHIGYSWNWEALRLCQLITWHPLHKGFSS
jgi:hypothetical protein